jgi:hypothetical protein
MRKRVCWPPHPRSLGERAEDASDSPPRICPLASGTFRTQAGMAMITKAFAMELLMSRNRDAIDGRLRC